MPVILQINSTANWGSTGRIAEHISEKAIQRGWVSYFVYGRNHNPSNSSLIRVGNILSNLIALVRARLLDDDGLSTRHATSRIISQIKKIGPDVIHIHNLHGYYINYQVLFEYLNSTSIPVVWTLHDCWAFTGHCSHFMQIGCNKWRTFCCNCPQKKSYPASWFKDESRRNFMLKKSLFSSNPKLHIVTVSHWLEGLVKDSFLKDKDIRVINNGVNLNVFSSTQHNRNERFRILGVSNVWTLSKGLEDFYSLRRILDVDLFEIVLVGVSKKQMKQLPAGITGVLQTSSCEELADYYSSADIFFNPTYSDTFPTTNLEALACGTPVLTYRTGGSPEAISPETGWVVEPGDLDTVVSILEEVRRQGKGHYQHSCRLRAELFYNKDERIEDYFDLYDSVRSQ